MKNCIYFVEKPEFSLSPAAEASGPASAAARRPPESALLVRGYGFTPEGFWRPQPLPAGAAGLLLDDRFLPNRQGQELCLQALSAWDGLILLDLERRPGPGTAALAEALARLGRPERIVLPPAWARLPHGALLLGPSEHGLALPDPVARRPGVWPPYAEAQAGGTGGTLPCLLDSPPLRHRAFPGGPWESWEGPLPEAGFPCPGPGCLHRRLPDGSVLLWDTKRTLAARCRAAGSPCLVFREDWDALPN